MTQPTQFAGVRVDSQFQNTAPVVPKIVRLTMKEDDSLRVRLDYFDDEGDAVMFSLLNGTDLGTVKISYDGSFSFAPCRNCYGMAYIFYRVTEMTIPVGKPLTADGTIEIEVDAVEDPPVIVYWTQSMKFPLMTTEPVRIVNDQNKLNETVELFFLGVVDPDTDDTLGLTYDGPRYGNITRVSTPLNWLTNHSELLANYSSSVQTPSVNSTMLRYVVSANFTGYDEFFVLGYDQDGAYSNLLKVEIYGLINPCSSNGRCNGSVADENCTGLDRAFSWQGYNCACFSGYTGVLCQTDVDECVFHPCHSTHDCINLDGSYSCKLKQLVLLAAILVPATVVITCVIAVAIAVVCKRKKRRQKTFDPMPYVQ